MPSRVYKFDIVSYCIVPLLLLLLLLLLLTGSD